MSVSLNTIRREQKQNVYTAINRRLMQDKNNRGLGYWGAIDAMKKTGQAIAEKAA